MTEPYYQDDSVTLHHGDALAVAQCMESQSVGCIVTSPPYFGLRDYGVAGQYGLEETPAEYVATMRALFDELRRVLADDGTLWLNLGDSYAGSWGNQGHDPKHADLHVKYRGAEALPTKRRTGSIRRGMPAAKNLIGIPWRVALALQDDGWILRNDIIWQKPNAMPESVRDRLSGRHEHVFLFSKSPRYWIDVDAIKVEYQGDRTPSRGAHRTANKANTIGNAWDGNQDKPRNPGDVWAIPTQPFPAAHFATMPIGLAQRCVLAGCRPGRAVLDPFSGSGTTGLAAQRAGRDYVGIDINREYLDLSLRTRLQDAAFDFGATS